MTVTTPVDRMTPERVELVRQVLLAPPERPNDRVAADLGCSREWVHRVRRGLSAVDLFPELPRYVPPRQHSCDRCAHWEAKPTRFEERKRKGVCGLGHHEALEIGPRFGVGCGAFMPGTD